MRVVEHPRIAPVMIVQERRLNVSSQPQRRRDLLRRLSVTRVHPWTWMRTVPAKLRDPVTWTDGLQIVKAVAAAVTAWLIALRLFGSEQAFLAPWSAVLTVHATVYRTLSRGVQQVAAAVVGVLISFAVASLFGMNAVTLALVLLLALTLGGLGAFRAEGLTITTTALIVVTTGSATSESLLWLRLLDTAIGIAVGIVVNLLVFPPLNDRSAARQVDVIDDRIGELLRDIASALARGCSVGESTEWVDRTRGLDHAIDHAWAVVSQARESGLLNLRRRAVLQGGACDGYGDVLRRLEQAVAESRSMARSLAKSLDSSAGWDAGFRDGWITLLADTGEAVILADAREIRDIRARVDELGRDLSHDDLQRKHWPTYGALLVNLRNILEALDEVAAAQPVTTARRHKSSNQARV